MNRARALLLAWLLVLASGAYSPAAASQPVVTCAGEAATLIGTEGPDVLTGTHGRDVIVGRGGDDIISGLGGNDIICGDAGDDTIDAGAGADYVIAGAGADTIRGGNGADQLSGGDGGDVIYGGAKNDTISGGNGNDKIFARSGDDTINAGSGNDRVRGEAGYDTINGGDGRDRCAAEVEHNCEVAVLGEQLDLIAAEDAIQFPASTPFHIRHGWACHPIEADCSITGEATILFELLVDGVPADHKGIELVTIVDEWRQKLWVFAFPDGMTGVHVLHGRWLEQGVLAHEELVSVDFS